LGLLGVQHGKAGPAIGAPSVPNRLWRAHLPEGPRGGRAAALDTSLRRTSIAAPYHTARSSFTPNLPQGTQGGRMQCCALSSLQADQLRCPGKGLITPAPLKGDDPGLDGCGDSPTEGRYPPEKRPCLTTRTSRELLSILSRQKSWTTAAKFKRGRACAGGMVTRIPYIPADRKEQS
jgi:hypothetical protein